MQKIITKFAQDEALAYHLYNMVAEKQTEQSHKEILKGIANQEKEHLNKLNELLDEKVDINSYSKGQYRFYKFILMFFGVIFTLRLFEKRERKSHIKYAKYDKEIPIITEVVVEEKKHEEKLDDILKDKKLLYASSVILGLNDALIEMSGAIAGFTFAVENTKEIAIVSLIMGVAASLSMAASEFLSARADDHENPFKSALYTFITYSVVVALLILPYLFLQKFIALGIMIGTVILIIFTFNVYLSIAKKESLIKNFLTMALIAICVSIVSFSIGILINKI
ncbi:MAG: VIT1/CCC1 transporter family protein [Acholeplasmatales bacterium]